MWRKKCSRIITVKHGSGSIILGPCVAARDARNTLLKVTIRFNKIPADS